MRQNQYQLAGVAKVLDIESTSINTSSNLNTVINLKPDIIEYVEEVCKDGIVSERDPITPFIHDTHAISSENPLEKYNPYISKSTQCNKSDPTEVENVIDVSSGEESSS